MSEPALKAVGPVSSALPPALRALLTPAAYPHATANIGLRETHVSWVILTGPCAYKVKKPLKLDFIDASTLERRRHLCEEELRLNRRFAPELYLDVVAVTASGTGATIGGDGSVIDYAVRMRQFAAADELPSLLGRDAVHPQQMSALGELIASLHLKAEIAPRQRAPERTEKLFQAVFGNLAQLLVHLSGADASPRLNTLIDWSHDTAQALEPVFRAREQAGFVRECHGDLHAANIVRLDDRLAPFDCIEFDPDLRWIDVVDDIAFLVMDLVSHERSDLALTLLSRYLEVTGDYEGLSVLPFCAVYRALVRAKVDALTLETVPARADEFRQRLQQRIRAASQWTQREIPALILMHGASGSGKSWMSARLVPQLQAVRIRSDLERKRLAGLDAHRAAAAAVREGIYSPEFSHRTYARLAECAEHCLNARLNTIVDASFLEPADRTMFRSLARRMGVPCYIVSCQADPLTLAQRLEERSAARTDPSDANLSVLDTQLREFAPFTAAEQGSVVAVDTSEPHAVARVASEIKSRIAG
ncbi:MAG TPA: AAA family ATPase [Steroidobacteraceae bacterium]|nr:AAA family ATPase [Steroidobacteraceae bacterium]